MWYVRIMRGAPLERTLLDLSRDLIAITPFAWSPLCFLVFKNRNLAKTWNWPKFSQSGQTEVSLRCSSDEMWQCWIIRSAPLERTASDLAWMMVAISPFLRSPLCFWLSNIEIQWNFQILRNLSSNRSSTLLWASFAVVLDVIRSVQAEHNMILSSGIATWDLAAYLVATTRFTWSPLTAYTQLWEFAL